MKVENPIGAVRPSPTIAHRRGENAWSIRPDLVLANSRKNSPFWVADENTHVA
jgi:hypothetical protein